MKKRKFKPRAIRVDILNNLPDGALKRISIICRCSAANVSNVLAGRKTDHYGIVEMGEMMAAIHIWQNRFCKYRSKIDLFNINIIEMKKKITNEQIEATNKAYALRREAANDNVLSESIGIAKVTLYTRLRTSNWKKAEMLLIEKLYKEATK